MPSLVQPLPHPSIQHKSLGEEIVDVLQREIIAGDFRPGQRLVERELIKRFGVSSIPIREGLQELENRGLVVKRHNCGCSVVQLTATEVARICELRLVLEPKVMEWAATRVTAARVERLSGQLLRLEKAAIANDLSTFFQEDIVFHRMAWEAAGNSFVVRALETTLGSLFASGVIGSRKGESIDLPVEWEKYRRLFAAQRAALALLGIAAEFEKHLPQAGPIALLGANDAFANGDSRWAQTASECLFQLSIIPCTIRGMASRMKDIARDLGVSVITVSKVLRDHPDISEATRDRVLRRMKELNYRPNLAARALVTGRTHCVGLVVPDLVHPFFAELAKSISQVLRERGYGLLISSSEEKADLELQEIEQMLSRGADAIIIASAQLTAEAFRQIEERKVRYVLLDRQFAGLPANFVGVDDELIGDLATEHLIAVGCRRIALITGPKVSTSIGRMKGYRRTLMRHGRDLRTDYVVSTETGDEAGEASGYHAMKRLLKINPQPDGVFCYNDPTALGAMKAIFEDGLHIPRDIAVIGCGNVVYASFLRVPLSSIDQSNSEMGTRAGELALLLIESKPKSKPNPQTVLLTPKVVARASTAR